MTPVADEAVPRIPSGKSPKKDTGALSQWQLIRLRFLRHKLAVASLFILLALYFVATFAPIFATYDSTHRVPEYSSVPPMLPKFSFERGLHTERVVRVQDPVTLKRTYVVDPSGYVPLGIFAKGQPYRLFGILPMDRHLITVDTSRLDEAGWTDSDIPPAFFFLGADQFGHDIYSRTIFGSRISLSIGLIAIVITFILGVTIGGISGYLGGWVDTVIQRAIEIVNSFPRIPLWLALAAVLPATWSSLQTYFAITILLSLINWTALGRVVRGKILSLREEDYAVAARLMGASHSRILFRHLLPGFTSHIIVVLTLSIPQMILGETALSFLGLGLRPPTVSWGVMLQDCLSLQTVANYPWLLMPVIMIIITVMAFNFLGDGLRDAADPYS